MLQSVNSPSQAQSALGNEGLRPDTEFLDLSRLLSACRRQMRPVILSILLGLAIAIVYLIQATPLYTAETDLLLNPDQGKSLDAQPQQSTDASQSDETILSQVALIGSTRIALQVTDKLDLTNDKVFMNPKPSLIASAMQSVRGIMAKFGIGGHGKGEAMDPRRLAAQMLQDNLSVDRNGRTFALNVSYTSPDAAFSAKIANAFADAYLNDSLEANFDSTQRTSTWLQGRLADLQQNLQQADVAVQKYRNDHGLIAADGKLISDQQMSELTSQLILAQADTARAKARYEQFAQVLKSNAQDALLNAAVATGAPDDSVIGRLRGNYLGAFTRLTDVIKQFGEAHPEVEGLKKEVTDDGAQLRAELDRVANGYQNDLSVAQAREQSLRNSLDQVLGTAASNNQTQIELRALQQKADSYRDLVQTFLQREQQASQEKSFPVEAARIISEADVPTLASSPRKPLVIAIGVLLGFVGGVGLGVIREFHDSFFRTGDQIRSELNMEYLGLVPAVDKPTGDKQAPPPEPGTQTRNVMNYVVDNPLSAFAETMRRIKIATDVTQMNAGPKVIGVVSVLPREGKSTISANLARLFAGQGARTLLVDADLRGLGLTHVMARGAEAGLLEVLLEGRPLAEVARVDPRTKMVFLPSVARRDVSHTADLLASPAMGSFLADTGADFDYIIVDLPPMAPVADARAFARHVDAVVMVIEWGGTARNIVRSTLASEPELASKMLGAVLNKVDIAKMKLYSDYGSNEYYYGRYSSYYTKS